MKARVYKQAMGGAIEGIEEIMSSLTDDTNSNVHIIVTKYAKYRHHINRFNAALVQFRVTKESTVEIDNWLEKVDIGYETKMPIINSIYLLYKDLYDRCDDRDDKGERIPIYDTRFLSDITAKIFFSKIQADIDAKPNRDEICKSIYDEYTIMQKSTQSHDILDLLTSLLTYARCLNATYIASIKNKSFITSIHSSTYIALLPITYLDVKALIIEDPTLNAKYVTLLTELYESSIVIYDIITSPNLDTVKFIELFVSSICALEKDLPDCSAAFGKLRESIHGMVDGFNERYRDLLVTGNQYSFGMNMLSDIINKSDAGINTSLTRQLKKIVRHVGRKFKSAQSNGKAAKISADLVRLFNTVDKRTKEQCVEDGDFDVEEEDDTELTSPDLDYDENIKRAERADKMMKEMIDAEEKTKRVVKKKIVVPVVVEVEDEVEVEASSSSSEEELSSEESSSEDEPEQKKLSIAEMLSFLNRTRI